MRWNRVFTGHKSSQLDCQNLSKVLLNSIWKLNNWFLPFCSGRVQNGLVFFFTISYRAVWEECLGMCWIIVISLHRRILLRSCRPCLMDTSFKIVKSDEINSRTCERSIVWSSWVICGRLCDNRGRPHVNCTCDFCRTIKDLFRFWFDSQNYTSWQYIVIQRSSCTRAEIANYDHFSSNQKLARNNELRDSPFREGN